MARLIDVQPGSPEWLAERRKGVTASEISAVLGISPHESAWSLWHRKRGLLPDVEDSEAMAIGRALEAFVIGRLRERRPDLWIGPTGLYAHDERDWQMATPDGIAYERVTDGEPVSTWEMVATVQAKTAALPGEEWGPDGSDQIPAHYEAQVQWEMDVLGVGAALVPVLFTTARQVRVYEIAADKDDQALMRERAQAFLASQEPPPVDAHPTTTWGLKRLHHTVTDTAVEVPATLIRQRQIADRLAKLAAARRDLADNRLRDLMRDAKTATVAGVKVASRSVYEIRERTLPATTVNKLTVTKKEIK